jgi:cyclic-di-GMP phosphodiesterase TipF (flagellum assembly factor)
MVYTFIALAAAALGAAAYFGLTFTPAEAILAAVVFGCVCVVLLERTLRQRAENRLEKAIEDLSRLLATDAQAGAVLGQRINAMADVNAGGRLDGVEADISVLGTVIRQVAEAVAEIEDRTAPPPAAGGERMIPAAAPAARREAGPVIPIEILRQAVAENRLIYHIQPVVTLPQRRPQGYDLVPRLMLEDGELADRADFMPRRGGEDVRRQIESVGLLEAITIARRSRTGGQPIALYIPLSRATLGDATAAEQLVVSLEANRAIASGLIFAIAEADWQELSLAERAMADVIARKGAGFSITGVKSLRLDVAELAAQGVRSLRIDAARFIEEPEIFTDFHASDIANYLARFDVLLLATGIANERQIIELLEDGITLVQGPHIAAPGPVRSDLTLEPVRPQLRRAE